MFFVDIASSILVDGLRTSKEHPFIGRTVTPQPTKQRQHISQEFVTIYQAACRHKPSKQQNVKYELGLNKQTILGEIN